MRASARGRALAAVVPLAVAFILVGCGAPGVLEGDAPRSPSPTGTRADGPSAAAPGDAAAPTASGAATDAPDEPVASVAPPATQTPPPVLPKPDDPPPNPYHFEPVWVEDAPTVHASLVGSAVDVYIACAEWQWSVRVDGVEHRCDVSSAMRESDDQLPIIALTGVPIVPGQAPRIEQQQYASWDPEEHWAGVLVVDRGVVPTAAELGARVGPGAHVLLQCPPGEWVISFGPGLDGCHFGGTGMELGPLPDQGALAVPAPVEAVPLHPGWAIFFGAR